MQGARIALSTSAERRYGGVSVFCALDEIGPASLDTILVVKTANDRLVHTRTVGRIRGAGCELLPTLGRPHDTVRLISHDDDELSRLPAAVSPAEANPCHGRTPRPRKGGEPWS